MLTSNYKHVSIARAGPQYLRLVLSMTHLQTLPQGHAIRNVLKRAAKRAVAKGTAPRFPLAQAIKVSNIAGIQALATIDPRPRESWSEPVEQGPNEVRQQWLKYKKELEVKMMEEWKVEWQNSKIGQHLKRIDNSLPSKRVLRLRNGMTRHQAYLFTQTADQPCLGPSKCQSPSTKQ